MTITTAFLLDDEDLVTPGIDFGDEPKIAPTADLLWILGATRDDAQPGDPTQADLDAAYAAALATDGDPFAARNASLQASRARHQAVV